MSGPAFPGTPLRLSRVVLVSDSPEDLAAAAEQMRGFGMIPQFVDTVLGPSEADAAGAPEPDVFILRKVLSRGELVECIEMARSDMRRARIKTVVLTRYHSAADRRRLIIAGARYLLATPVNAPVLQRVLRAALEDLAASEAIQDFVTSHRSGVGRLIAGVFEIRTTDEAQKLASMLATNYPSPEEVAIGIWELLSNAIEHGNLEIDFEEKALLLEAGRFEQEVRRRLCLPQYADRSVHVNFRRLPKEIRMLVTDCGPGFDSSRFLGAEPPVNRPNGRGIFMAERLSFDILRYRGRGNVAEAVVRLTTGASPQL